MIAAVQERMVTMMDEAQTSMKSPEPLKRQELKFSPISIVPPNMSPLRAETAGDKTGGVQQEDVRDQAPKQNLLTVVEEEEKS